jgi:hypothetical protein
MKNIHIIPTDKPTGIFESKNGLHFSIIEKIRYGEFKGFHIYITNDEEIKEGDWFLLDMSHSSHPNEVHQMGHNKWSKTGGINFSEPNSWTKACKKIILTTDANLIKDGVQEIDEEYLEWFVKNPSCESVQYVGDDCYYEIIIPQEEPKKEVTGVDDNRPKPNYCYAKEQGHGEIGCVFPACHCGLPIKQEEPKQIKCYCGHTITCDCEPLQETLEDAAESWVNNRFTKQICGNESYPDIHASKEGIVESHIIFAKWQKERMYSKEDLKEAYFSAISSTGEGWNAEYANGNNPNIEEKFSKGFTQWFEQFKKK